MKNGFSATANVDTQVQRSPFNFVRNGYYAQDYGATAFVGSMLYYWQRNFDPTDYRYARVAYSYIDALEPQYRGGKGHGYALRCLVRWAHWQLPTYDGTKSYQNLLVEVYGGTWNSDWLNWPNANMDAILHNPAINLVRSGYYKYDPGVILHRSSDGDYWQSRVYSETNARGLDFISTRLLPQYSGLKGDGFTLRCLVR